MNMYGYSKIAFDQYFAAGLHHLQSPVVGPREQHNNSMIGVVLRFSRPLREISRTHLF